MPYRSPLPNRKARVVISTAFAQSPRCAATVPVGCSTLPNAAILTEDSNSCRVVSCSNAGSSAPASRHLREAVTARRPPGGHHPNPQRAREPACPTSSAPHIAQRVRHLRASARIMRSPAPPERGARSVDCSQISGGRPDRIMAHRGTPRLFARFSLTPNGGRAGRLRSTPRTQFVDEGPDPLMQHRPEREEACSVATSCVTTCLNR
jgi:hypothetical protein